MSSLSLPPYSSLSTNQLSEHVHKCLLASGRLHRIHCAGEAVHGFLAQRFVTTVVVVTILVSVSLW